MGGMRTTYQEREREISNGRMISNYLHMYTMRDSDEFFLHVTTLTGNYPIHSASYAM